jgi:signal transduction histidine kinase/ligand-binding sensor domain-containing protein
LREDYYAFLLQRSGQLWLHIGYGEKGEIYCFDTKTRQYRAFGPAFGDRCVADTNATGSLRAVYAFQYGAPGGLHRTAVSADMRPGDTHLLLPNDTLYDLWIQRDSQVWVAAKGGLIALNPYTGCRTLYTLEAAKRLSTRALRPLSDSMLAVASYGNGLLLFNFSTKKFKTAIRADPGQTNALSADDLDGLHVDKARNLWVSDWGKGLNFFNLDKPKIRQIPLGDVFDLESRRHPTYEKIRGLAEDHLGRIWIATKKIGLFVLENAAASPRVTRFRAGLPERDVLSLFCDRQGTIWVATTAGLFYLDAAAKQFRKVPGSDQLHLHHDCHWQQISDTQILLSCEGFFVIKRETNNTFSATKRAIHPTLDAQFCPYFYQDKTGTLYCNINYAATMALRPGGSLHTLPLNNLRDAWEPPGRDTVWLATTYGLAKLDKKTMSFVLYDESNGLPNQYLYAVLPDAKGFLWLPSNKGILRFNPQTGTAQQLTAADGLFEEASIPKGALRTADGTIWMASPSMLHAFRPEAIRWLNTPPNIQITHLKINDTDADTETYIGESTTLAFPYAENTLSFEFSALEYSDPTNNRLTYRLEGYDQDWVESAPGIPGFARYAHLAPGHYVFQIKAANSDGVWTDAPKCLNIVIHPPFWQTLWFKMTLVVLLALAVWGSTRVYLRRQLQKQRVLIEKQEALQSERNRIAGELHDDLGHGLSGIKAISEMAKQWNLPDENRQQLNKIWLSSMELIEKMGDIIWAIDSGNDTLENLLLAIRAYTAETLDTHGIAGTFQLPESIPKLEMSGERRRNILLLVKECLHNIVKHSGATAVSLHIDLSDGLTLLIRDNGHGFVEKTSGGRGGHGLRNMQKRAQAAGGTLETRNSPQGVTVLFSLKL